ncbi:P-loop containing nucleoside triphosphate hydrolase protein [Mycena olivaceomarginata]|nr:P-loop containing nucleoside triphosphate hydrolase protein [Mycena olivaceomarginata]
MPRSSLNLRQEETIAHHLVSLTGNCESSDSFSLLPASPKIFYGRGAELTDIIETLASEPARIAILGPGGMGKTTLALAALHHPTIVEKYAFKYFISCESANTHADMVTTIGLHLGLEPSRQLAKAIVHHFVQCNSCLLVLDNLETPWEPLESRGQVEDFLSLLTDIPSLALLVTMRGAERPGKVKWHRPFLAPLEPLSASASRQIFLEVADDPASGEESALHDLLDLSGSLPLAVSLMASIASFEGYSGTLSRWQIENIALLSDGHDKRSNLEKSIVLSLSSPRLSSSPHAKYLLALLSLLPDGIRAEELMASHVPIPDIRQSQTLLLRTSLAHMDTKGRIKALSPIREYIRRVHPPSAPISRPLRIYFQDLLELWHSTRQLPSGNLSSQLVGYLGNINTLMLNGLITDDRAALKAIGYSIVTLDEFSAVMIKGNSPLFQRLPHLIEVTGDPVLRWRYGRRCLRNPDSLHSLSEDPDVWIEDGAKYFGSGNHSAGEGM